MDSIIRYKKIKRRIKVKSVTNDEKDKFNEIIDPQINYEQLIGPRIIKETLSSERRLVVSLVIFRVFNAFINQTSFVPDEYYQSTEIAHRMAFGVGHTCWEWASETAIRSPLYPLAIAALLWVMRAIGADWRVAVIRVPMVMHALLAAVSDWSLYTATRKTAGQRAAQWALFHQLVNWFTMYSCTRTLVNNLEWTIVTIALLEYQTIAHQSVPLSRRLVLLIGLCFVLRPTGLVLLFPVCIYHLVTVFISSRGTAWRSIFTRSIGNCCLVGVFILSVSLLVDKHFYGRWTCSQLNFLHFNLLTDVSQTYGVHPWHWYFTNALPSMLGTQLITLLVAIWSEWGDRDCRCLIGLAGIVLHVYSFLGHKEFRFIFPLMPIAMHLMGRMFDRFPSKRKAMVIFLLVTQVPMSFYMSLIHQRGGNDVIMALGRHIEQHRLQPDNLSAVFLMPCHSTPWYSHLHYNISARFLTCDPQITGGISLTGDEPLRPSGSLKNYDEADLFYDDPIKWLNSEYSDASIRPVFWVMFEQLSPQLHRTLTQWNYHICKQFFHAHFPTHRRHSTKIFVYCKRNYFL